MCWYLPVILKGTIFADASLLEKRSNGLDQHRLKSRGRVAHLARRYQGAMQVDIVVDQAESSVHPGVSSGYAER